VQFSSEKEGTYNLVVEVHTRKVIILQKQINLRLIDTINKKERFYYMINIYSNILVYQRLTLHDYVLNCRYFLNC